MCCCVLGLYIVYFEDMFLHATGLAEGTLTNVALEWPWLRVLLHFMLIQVDTRRERFLANVAHGHVLNALMRP